MKRTREDELRQVAKDIIHEGRKKDEYDQPLYPVLLEPLVITFFNAVDPLLEVLRERPLIILNLIQTNKELQRLFHKFSGLWILLIDVLIEKAMGTNAVFIYPFMELLWRREDANDNVSFISLPYASKRTFEWPTTPYRIIKRNFTSGSINLDYNRAKTFYIVYRGNNSWYDLLNDFVRLVADIQTFMVGPIQESSYIYKRYTSYDIYATPEGWLPPSHPESSRIRADIERMLDALRQSNNDALEYLGEKLLDLLPTSGVLEEPRFIKLDEVTGAIYRDQLYNPQTGVYPTAETQKNFFLRIVRRLALLKGKDSMIEDYGEQMKGLNCVVCQTESLLVDPLLALPFCSALCRNTYSQ